MPRFPCHLGCDRVSAEKKRLVIYNHHCKTKNIYRIIPNRGAVRQGNGLEIHNLETELILPVFKSKLYHYQFQRYCGLKITVITT